MPDPSLITALRTAGCVFAEEEAALLNAAATNPLQLEDLLRRRIAGEPLESILGWAEFCGLRVSVAPGVFVPRARTGLLVARAVAAGPGVLLDLCCGTGAIAMAVQQQLPSVEIYCADIDPVAVECAQKNVPAHRVFVSDLFGDVPGDLRGRIDVVIMSPPYVPTAQIVTMPAEARDYEPRRALDGGSDGLAIARRALHEAQDWISRNGRLIFETSRAQAGAAAAAAAEAGWLARVEIDDDLEATAIECRLS